jgi:thermostable 8-oxoguanine DNA glycosylase
MGYMVDPKNITKFDRTEAELQEFLLFCIVVAGKNSHQQAKKLDRFITNLQQRCYTTPFGNLQSILLDSEIYERLAMVKMGQYRRITKAFRQVSELPNLQTVSLEQLEATFGIGPKTARFFLLHTRPNQQYAVLDTHILKWMRSMGYPAPKATPNGKRYAELEKQFLAECDRAGMTPASMDLHIWKTLSTPKEE